MKTEAEKVVNEIDVIIQRLERTKQAIMLLASLQVKMPDTKEYGRMVKIRRQKKGLNMTQLSQLSGVSPSHISRIERGIRSPNFSIVIKLEKALS